MSGSYTILLLGLALPALRPALDSTRLVAAYRSTRSLGLLGLLQMMLRDPLLLVAACAGRSDSANWGRGLGNLALLGLGSKGEVGVVAKATKETSDDEVSR